MIFEAQIKEIKVKETVSNDKECRIVLITNDTGVLDLQRFIARDTVKVEVKDGQQSDTV